MISIKQLMSNDHNHCDELFIEAENHVLKKNWSEADQALNHFINTTLDHFRHEENTLFPAFENATGMTSGPTEVMRHEHQQLRQLINDLSRTVEEQNKDRYLSTSETLLIFIRQHNMKEEQVLYPMIEQSCSQDADELMKDFINKDKSSAA
ncbi:MAG: hemerythrin domain-containing protein [Gammaproteobacteria bacterium]|nr:hemerythrin domain-containing protein [Gammaproteobacteria bacterium]MCW8910541.1 hemerythrin domain-containing protein [Gammaproteobacteria bacterium]MCW9004716.1 hemerythrin domain-containing protein [Gammaproteobacteria bacterium]MCW9056540.1 hemerythrin domain-containing protein [Gammaproteobacteria bacterium]